MPVNTRKILASECHACYDGDMKFPTFAECWAENPEAHTFEDQTHKKDKMKTGAFKSCFIGIFGVKAHALPAVIRNICNYDPKLTTRDIVTCCELGVQHDLGCVFAFALNDTVLVVKDVLRPALTQQTGVIRGVWECGYVVRMCSVMLKEVGLVTTGSLVRVDCSDDVLHNQEGTAIDDGKADGWCHVQIDSTSYKIPTIWLKVIDAESSSSWENNAWEDNAWVPMLSEQMVPAHRSGEYIPFKGDNTHAHAGKEIISSEMVRKFDPYSIITSKVFTMFDMGMQDWPELSQKDAIIDCLCKKHALNPYEFLEEEYMTTGNTVYFNWEGCVGTQSVFECGEGGFFYVDNTNPSIRAQARIGKFCKMLGEIVWESSDHHTVGNKQLVSQRDESLLVIGSRVAHRRDSTRTGTIRGFIENGGTPRGSLGAKQKCSRCQVEWDASLSVLHAEEIETLERSIFMQQVMIPPHLLHGKISHVRSNPAPDFVLVHFQGSSFLGNRIGEVWFNFQQLNDGRLRHKLYTYLSYPWRVARFTVQERVGVAISDLLRIKHKWIIYTASALTAFYEALATFCRGVSDMHRNDITHGDLHPGNITITQTTDNEFFCVKMIDFDRMQEHRPNKCDTVLYRFDLLEVVQCIMKLTNNVECRSQDATVKHNFASRQQHVHGKASDMRRIVRAMPSHIPSATSADYLFKLSRHCVVCPA